MDYQAPDDRDMEPRIAQLEADVAVMKVDIGVIKATGATKADMSELRAELKTELRTEAAQIRKELAETKTAIILWVASTFVLAQTLPLLIRMLEKTV